MGRVPDHTEALNLQEGEEVGRCRLFIKPNEERNELFGAIENVFVYPGHRSKGIGGKVVRAAIAKAKQLGCYKLCLTARENKPELHKWYESLGFKNHGRSFRIDFK